MTTLNLNTLSERIKAHKTAPGAYREAAGLYRARPALHRNVPAAHGQADPGAPRPALAHHTGQAHHLDQAR